MTLSIEILQHLCIQFSRSVSSSEQATRRRQARAKAAAGCICETRAAKLRVKMNKLAKASFTSRAKNNQEATKIEALQLQVRELNQTIKSLLNKWDEKEEMIQKLLQRINPRAEDSDKENKMNIPATDDLEAEAS